jgi:hypothetical protein
MGKLGSSEMTKKLAVMGAVLTLSVAGSAAFAAVSNGEQKGSLLIWPRIDLTGGNTTVVSVTNDGPQTISLKCYFMDRNKNYKDREITLTRENTYRLEVDSYDFPDSPKPETNSKGLLVCWAQAKALDSNAVDAGISWNHLFGSATIINFTTGTASEYKAWSFRSTKPIGTPLETEPGILPLDGINYDTCPQNLLGTFYNRTATIGGVAISPVRQLLTVASCSLDLRQYAEFLPTKLEFDIFDDLERKYTGTYECSDSWHETYLGEPFSPARDADNFPATWPNMPKQYTANGGTQAEYNPSNFKISNRPYGYYRVYTSSKANCNARVKINGSTATARTVGLVGVQITELGSIDSTASDLSFSGAWGGVIKYDTAQGTPTRLAR